MRAAPSTLRGSPTGPAVLVPAMHRLMRYCTMHYELEPDGR